jgi:hypothetical protein
MATRADVRRIALSLPAVEEVAGRFAFAVRVKGKAKQIAWVWMERVDPGKPRIPNPDVLVVRVASLREKDTLIAAHPGKLFTEPHYHGFPAVLVRLKDVPLPQMTTLIVEAWRTQASKDLILMYQPDAKSASQGTLSPGKRSIRRSGGA